MLIITSKKMISKLTLKAGKCCIATSGFIISSCNKLARDLGAAIT
jgi:hypothetical protein